MNFKIGERVRRIKERHLGAGINPGDLGTVIQGGTNPNIKWDNGKACHSFSKYLEVVVTPDSNIEAKGLLTKEW